MDENKESPEIISTDSPSIGESQPPTKNSKSILMFIIAGIILLIIGVAVGWYFSQNSSKKDMESMTPSPTITTSKVKMVEKVIDLYKISLELPSDWKLEELGKRPAPTAIDELVNSQSQDCAEYIITNKSNTLRINIYPPCGYSDGGSDELKAEYVTVKKYSDGHMIARFYDPTEKLYYYTGAGFVDITDETGDHKVLMYSGKVPIGPNDEHHVGTTILEINIDYSGDELAKEAELSLADEIIASLNITKTQVSPTATGITYAPDVKSYFNDVLYLGYPGTWVPKEQDNESVIFYDYTDESTFGPDSVVNIFLYDNLGKITFDDPVGKKVEQGDKLYSTKLENITVSGETAMQIKNEVGEGSATDSTPGITTIIPYKDKYLFVSLRYTSIHSSNEELDIAYKKILESISLNK